MTQSLILKIIRPITTNKILPLKEVKIYMYGFINNLFTVLQLINEIL